MPQTGSMAEGILNCRPVQDQSASDEVSPRLTLRYHVCMNPPQPPSSATSYTGYVKNGVIVLDTNAGLVEGQAVRVVPLGEQEQIGREKKSAERMRQLQQLFAEWTDEDGKLSDEDADRLRAALIQNRGIGLRSPVVD